MSIVFRAEPLHDDIMAILRFQFRFTNLFYDARTESLSFGTLIPSFGMSIGPPNALSSS
jgi:hypothetical protein